MIGKGTLSPIGQKRLQKEEQNLIKDGFLNLGFEARPRKDQQHKKNYSIWDIYIYGTENTLYEDTTLHALMEFGYDYPNKPPTMRFISQMFHPNIYPDGKVCISSLHENNDDDPTSYERSDEKWSPVLTIRSVVLGVISILNEPNVTSPANVDASKMLNHDEENYNRRVRKLALVEDVSYLIKKKK